MAVKRRSEMNPFDQKPKLSIWFTYVLPLTLAVVVYLLYTYYDRLEMLLRP